VIIGADLVTLLRCIQYCRRLCRQNGILFIWLLNVAWFLCHGELLRSNQNCI